MTRRSWLAGLGLALAALLATGCPAPAGTTATPAGGKPFSIAVFVPGVVDGSPTYEMMVAGVNQACTELAAKGRQVSSRVVEAGFNQAEWLQSLTALAAEGTNDLIVSSNPSLPDLAVKVLESFPATKFLILDARLDGNPGIKTVGFDQYQQGYLNGRLAALLADPAKPHRFGLLAGQEYPVMDQDIKAGYLDGARSIHADAALEFRVLGNWYDAAKAEELTLAMAEAGCQTVLAIAGGGNQGAVNAARKTGLAVTWFDSPGYSFGAGVVKGGTVVNQTGFCRQAVIQAVEGSLDYGQASLLGIADGAVDLAWAPELEAALGSSGVADFRAHLAGIKDGSISLPRKP